MQFGGGPPRGGCKSIRRDIACKALNGPYFAFLLYVSTGIAKRAKNRF